MLRVRNVKSTIKYPSITVGLSILIRVRRFDVFVLEGPIVHKLPDWHLPCSTPFLLHLYLFQVISLLRVRPEAFLDCNGRKAIIADEHQLSELIEQHTLTYLSILALGL